MNAPTITGLAPPLRVLPDMAPSWRHTDLDFDAAAQQLVERHEEDGDARDLPVLDLRTWGGG